MPSRPRIGRSAVLAAVAGAALGLGACGTSPSSTAGAGPSSASGVLPAPTPPSRGGPAPAAEVAVIRDWANALRRGDVATATSYFGLPATIANGTPPLQLTDRNEVRAFNDSLPCGAVLVASQLGPRGYVIATFRLTERPGPGSCAGGVGGTASTAFRIRGGRIYAWLRVATPPNGGAPTTPEPSEPAPTSPTPLAPTSTSIPS